MNHPRPSILQLFDPLSSRDIHSPESDKENTLPDSDFFPQTYVKHPSPVRLTRRLVEVGDVTVVEFEVAGGEGDRHQAVEEEEGEGEGDENDTVGLRSLPSPRTPLGDVTFDRERTPMRSKMYRRKANPTTSAGSDAVPDDFAFASVSNAVNASGAAFGGPSAAPSVVISAAEDSPSSSVGDTDALSTSLATLSLSTPTGSLIADTTMAFPTPSEASTSLLVPVAQPLPPPASIASFDIDRSSADLHSSFALHMNMNSESSFDLLNDKISFFGQGCEESFDMGGLGLISEESNENDTHSPLADHSNNTQREMGHLSVTVDSTTKETIRQSPSSPGSPLQVSDTLQESVDQHPDTFSATPFQPPIMPSLNPVFVPPPASQSPPIPVLSTSFPEPPTFVPALKIVKRKRLERKSVPKAADLPGATSLLPDTVPAPEPPAPSTSSAARMAPSSVGRYVTEGPGPWRVPISTSGKEKAAVTAGKPTAAVPVSGPRRVPLPNQAPAPAPAPAPVPPKAPSQVAQAAGLKRPLRVVPPNGSTSGLPRAVGGISSGSRLPMPKSKIAGATGGGIGLPRRRVA
ncbi:hypothetical protein DFH07DRAFT_826593 [Mycena maculata]|uniref:Uncharacterized protein n=1 Tax=Mycena maculata TaxID=230809 RepID=A0AAD7N9A5_9AGAR|nr:hypothetical protein DFH07DRAFT_826593 [Mycena maculata]